MRVGGFNPSASPAQSGSPPPAGADKIGGSHVTNPNQSKEVVTTNNKCSFSYQQLENALSSPLLAKTLGVHKFCLAVGTLIGKVGQLFSNVFPGKKEVDHAHTPYSRESLIFSISVHKPLIEDDFTKLGENGTRADFRKGINTSLRALTNSLPDNKKDVFNDFIKKLNDPQANLHELKPELDKLLDEINPSHTSTKDRIVGDTLPDATFNNLSNIISACDKFTFSFITPEQFLNDANRILTDLSSDKNLPDNIKNVVNDMIKSTKKLSDNDTNPYEIHTAQFNLSGLATELVAHLRQSA